MFNNTCSGLIIKTNQFNCISFCKSAISAIAISDIFEKRLGFRPRKPKNKEQFFLGSGN
jgi:hypothetical protein